MDKQQYDDADEALKKAIALIEHKSGNDFSKNEIETLKEVAKTWSSAKGAVFLAGSIGSALKWLLGMAVLWGAFKAGFFNWLRLGLDE